MNDNIVTNASLILRLQAGDEKSLGELMARYQSRIWPLILTESRNYQDAEDILSRTWQAVWENINGLRDVSSFGGWLRKIAYNQCRRYYNNAYHSQGERPYEDEVLTWHADRSATTLFREETLKVDAVEAVIHLPSKPEYMQEVAVLFYLRNLKIEDIHVELGLPEGTIKRKLFEAREFLRREFDVEHE